MKDATATVATAHGISKTEGPSLHLIAGHLRLRAALEIIGSCDVVDVDTGNRYRVLANKSSGSSECPQSQRSAGNAKPFYQRFAKSKY